MHIFIYNILGNILERLGFFQFVIYIEIDRDIDPRVPLTLRLRDIVTKNALQLIMDQTGFTCVFKDDTVFITAPGSWAEKEYLPGVTGASSE